MAEVRSEMLLVVRAAPPLDELAAPPPCLFDLLVFDRTFGSKSESTGPEADGGALYSAADNTGTGEWARGDAVCAGVDGPLCSDDGLLADM